MYQTAGVLEVLNLLHVCGIDSVQEMSGGGPSGRAGLWFMTEPAAYVHYAFIGIEVGLPE